jgi:hypothetical protein
MLSIMLILQHLDTFLLIFPSLIFPLYSFAISISKGWNHKFA